LCGVGSTRKQEEEDKEAMANIDAVCRQVQKNIEKYELMKASEAQNCAKVEVSRCDEQSAGDDKNAQSVTHYHTV